MSYRVNGPAHLLDACPLYVENRLTKYTFRLPRTKLKNKQLCGSWVPYTHLLVSPQQGAEYST